MRGDDEESTLGERRGDTCPGASARGRLPGTRAGDRPAQGKARAPHVALPPPRADRSPRGVHAHAGPRRLCRGGSEWRKRLTAAELQGARVGVHGEVLQLHGALRGDGQAARERRRPLSDVRPPVTYRAAATSPKAARSVPFSVLVAVGHETVPTDPPSGARRYRRGVPLRSEASTTPSLRPGHVRAHSAPCEATRDALRDRSFFVSHP